mmetsp:Transcript_98617/g.120745  ORF Transcript_98617/g.120745 Transcript_98617/m.120745 type:complete len:326 (+) Transcript_98617:44-1021(+)
MSFSDQNSIINELIGIGFDKFWVEKALQLSKGHKNLAIEWLLSDELGYLNSGWKCYSCESKVPSTKNICTYCNAKKPSKDVWICESCTFANNIINIQCQICYQKKPDNNNIGNNNNNNNNNGNSGEMMNHIDDNHNGNTGGNDGELGDGIPTNTGGFAMTDEENSDNDVAVPASNYNNNDIDAVLAEGKPDGGANIVVDEESLKTDDDFDNGNDIDVDEISENAPNNENGVYKPQLQDMVNQNIKKKQDKKNSGLKRNDSVNDHIYLVEQIERQQAKENENKNNNNVDNIELFGNALKQGINDENLDFNDIVEEMEMDRRKSNAQ